MVNENEENDVVTQNIHLVFGFFFYILYIKLR